MAFFREPRFLPLFTTQFLGACNDNLLKNGLIMLLTYRMAKLSGPSIQVLVTVAGSLLVLPFLCFSGLAGQLADKFDKARLARIIKAVEIGIMALAALGFCGRSLPLLFAALLGMGVHSTFFGPVKYALLPAHLRADELLPGNAMIEGGTFLAILLGTLLGSALVLLPQGGPLLSGALLLAAYAGLRASRFIPPAPAPDPGLALDWNFLAENIRIIGFARQNPMIFRCILAASWFWLMGAVLLAELAPYVKIFLHAGGYAVTLLLAVFCTGIGAGSLLCNRLLRGRIRLGLVPFAALAISAFTADLYFAAGHAPGGLPITLAAWLRTALCWRVMLDLFMISAAGGLYIVPLTALIQQAGAPRHLARLIAVGNVMNALFMVAGSAFTVLLLSLGLAIPQIFLVLATANLGAAAYAARVLPEGTPSAVPRR